MSGRRWVTHAGSLELRAHDGRAPGAEPDVLDEALQRFEAGDHAAASVACEAVLRGDAGHAGALHLLALVACGAGDLDRARQLMERALDRAPDLGPCLSNLAFVLGRLGRFVDAEHTSRRALAAGWERAETYNNLGIALRGQRRVAPAEEAFRRAATLDPMDPLSRVNRGVLLQEQGNIDEALAEYYRAIELRGDFSDAHSNLGAALKEAGRLGEAIEALERAIALAPDDAGAHNNLGATLADAGRVDEAIRHYERAYELAPRDTRAGSNLLAALNYDPRVTPKALLEEHRRWANRQEPPPAPDAPRHANPPDPERRLRIGYLSPDLHDHPVAYFVEPILASHDRSRIEAVCYCDSLATDAVTERMRGLAHEWRDVAGDDDARLAERIREDGIDILVELAGHTARNRLRAVATRPAPIQASYLGYPSTTGLESVDYRITDSIADPPGDADRHYSERLLRLPDCFCCYSPAREAPDVGVVPSERTGHVTFASLNKSAKLRRPILEIWGEILRRCPGARLLLQAREYVDPGIRDQMRARLGAADVDPSAVDFEGALPVREHLGLYARVDVALDPQPWNGHTTTCHALWMGVPVVALAGDRHASRMAASVLHACSLEDLVAHTASEYVEIAVALAHEPPLRARLRDELRDRLRRSSLMDGRGFTLALERAYRDAWREWCAIATARS